MKRAASDSDSSAVVFWCTRTERLISVGVRGRSAQWGEALAGRRGLYQPIAGSLKGDLDE